MQVNQVLVWKAGFAAFGDSFKLLSGLHKTGFISFLLVLHLCFTKLVNILGACVVPLCGLHQPSVLVAVLQLTFHSSYNAEVCG